MQRQLAPHAVKRHRLGDVLQVMLAQFLEDQCGLGHAEPRAALVFREAKRENAGVR